jgi:acetyl-CoA C-acetyltransferase
MAAEVVLLSAVRTAIGKFGGALRGIPAQQLGAIVIREAVKRAGINERDADEIIMGNVIAAGLGQNPARQAAVHAGIPVGTPSFTVNKVCGSGLKAVMLAAQAIKAGDADIIVAGGMENMSAAPHLLNGLRWGVKFGDAPLEDAMIHDGLIDAFKLYHMGMTGERVAEKYGITREKADEFSLDSQRKAADAENSGNFSREIVPVSIGERLFDRDECIREDTTIDKLAALPPAFKENGILTAGNSSKLSDGAAAIVVTSAGKAMQLGIKPLCTIVDYSAAGTLPENVMEAPIPAVRKLLGKTGLTIDDMDLFEHNEAYSSASIAVARELAVDPARFNIRGGAVALGHPLGASGARVLVTLVHALRDKGVKRGLATLCLGGGNAVAMIIENKY